MDDVTLRPPMKMRKLSNGKLEDMNRDNDHRVACVVALLSNNGGVEDLFSVDGDILKFGSKGIHFGYSGTCCCVAGSWRHSKFFLSPVQASF